MQKTSRIVINEFHKYLSSKRFYIMIRSKTSVWLCIYAKKLLKQAKCKTFRKKMMSFLQRKGTMYKKWFCVTYYYIQWKESHVAFHYIFERQKIQIKLYCILCLPRTILLIFFVPDKKSFNNVIQFLIWW